MVLWNRLFPMDKFHGLQKFAILLSLIHETIRFAELIFLLSNFKKEKNIQLLYL